MPINITKKSLNFETTHVKNIFEEILTIIDSEEKIFNKSLNKDLSHVINDLNNNPHEYFSLSSFSQEIYLDNDPTLTLFTPKNNIEPHTTTYIEEPMLPKDIISSINRLISKKTFLAEFILMNTYENISIALIKDSFPFLSKNSGSINFQKEMITLSNIYHAYTEN